ncbi:hypothetical protein [Mariprofundus sp. EBB-1]|uniref:hypothetical protein n=1 Tax=Mariprofundus sp. EBB-1 TaxID=2650971 RepID=UPI001F314DC6|nr:hypothetical protein [Mariprofundus sp. EBB-1]
MKKYMLACTLAMAFAFYAPLSISTTSFGYQQAQAAGAADADTGMKRVTLIIKKLRDAMGSMKDFDELEKAGLQKKDVDRMRRAMDSKIQQMMEDAIYAIRSI